MTIWEQEAQYFANRHQISILLNLYLAQRLSPLLHSDSNWLQDVRPNWLQENRPHLDQ